MTWWIKIDAGWYENPKIQQAGPEGGAVFHAILCINGMRNFDGRIPNSFITADYMARKTGFDKNFVEKGLAGLYGARVLSSDDDQYHTVINGWNDEWRPLPCTNAERQKRFKDRQRQADVITHLVTEGNGGNGKVTGNVDQTRSDQTRSDQTRPDQTKYKAASRARRLEELLGKHGEDVEHLWSEQNRLRRAAMPRSRELTRTPNELYRIAERLEDGFSVADCEHVLNIYALDARAKPDSRQWFNGVTNWRPDNFARAMGRTAADSSISTRLTSEQLRQMSAGLSTIETERGLNATKSNS